MSKASIMELISQKAFVRLKAEFVDMNPADIAQLFTELIEENNDFGEKEFTLVYRILPKELAADTFAYMNSDLQMMLINAFSDTELREIIDDLFLDDTVDIIEEMPAFVVSRILKNTDVSKRRQINELLHYPEDSAGSIMTTEFVYFKVGTTVKDAIDRVRSVGLVKETVYNCYVTDSRRLVGTLTLLDLLVADDDKLVEELMESNVITVETKEDQEAVAHIFAKYDLLALPVVDTEQRLVGIITYDDAIDVIREENAEDILQMNAVVPSEDTYFKTSVLKHARNRIVWLLVLMLSATVSAAITMKFEAQIAAMPLLVAFTTMLTDTGGNSGAQSSSMIIQGMALEQIHFKDFFKVVMKELRIALVCGIALAVVNFVRILLFYSEYDNVITVGLVVSGALICTVVMAKLLGCMLPLLAKRIRLDPALMAAPIITTVVDACSILIYFSLASHFLPI